MIIVLAKKYIDKKVIISLLAAVGFVLIAAFFMRATTVNAAVGGPLCRVPADYPTIQAAINDPGCATVRVAPGTYNENLTINRSVKIRGAEAGDSVVSRTFGAATESIVTGSSSATVTIDADDVVFDGFSVTNPGGHLGIIVKSSSSDVKIQNNIVDGLTSSTANPVGVYLELGPDSVNVRGNKVQNLTGTGFSAQGVLVGDSTSANPSLETKLDNNIFTNITSTKGAYGINVNNGSSTAPTATGYTEVKIRGNDISDLEGNWVHAIGLEGETPNAIVRFNKISQLTDIDPTPIADASAVFFEKNQFYFTVQVNRNSLDVGNSAFGVALHPTLQGLYPSLSVDAECNWWGDKDGPSVYPATDNGSWVGPQVDYEPWLKNGNLNGKCSNRYGHHEDNDHHHGDKDCKYDDVRGDRYRD